MISYFILFVLSCILCVLFQFVTHVNCQQVMKNIWTNNNPNILRKSYSRTALYFLWQLAVLPFVYIGYFFFPWLKYFDYYKTPMMKFFGETVSYIVFLCLIFYDTRHRHDAVRGPGQFGGCKFITSFCALQCKLIVIHGRTS